MRSTDIKNYLKVKENEFNEVKTLLLNAQSVKTTVVYQGFSYTASGLKGKLVKIQNQIKGALNIVENMSAKVWGVDSLAFMENLAQEEFPCHLAIDVKFNSKKLEMILKKTISEMGSANNEVTLKRLNGIKDHLLFNITAYSDYTYRENWIRDRYFEIAAFIEYKGDFPVMDYTNNNTIYDILAYGEKTLDEMKSAGLLYDVIEARRAIIQENADKDVFYEINHR